MVIRPAAEADVGAIYALIVALAEYEHAPEQVTGTPELLLDALFGARPAAEAVIADLDGQPVGFALFHGTFSTWECRPGLWLEDFFVLPQHRRHGIGERLFRHVAAVAVQRGCSRYGWVALNWNEPGLSFYRKHGAAALPEWLVHRLSGVELERVASGS